MRCGVWPILPSRLVEIGGKPIGIMRLAEPLLLCGTPTASSTCKSTVARTVPLSRGINEGDRIRCNYHGVEVGPDGTVLAVPGQPGCPLEVKKALKTYPSRRSPARLRLVRRCTQRKAGAVPIAAAARARRLLPHSLLCRLGTHWRLVYHNNMDPMHGTFLHANSHTMYTGDTQARFITRETPTGAGERGSLNPCSEKSDQ